MEVYCTHDFKTQFLKLKKNKKYQDLEQLILDHFFDKSIKELQNGDLLNGSDTVPFIKKRLPDSSGYRVYFYLIIKNDKIYLSWVHPKIGPMGMANIGPIFKKQIQKDIIEAIKANALIKLTNENGLLNFI